MEYSALHDDLYEVNGVLHLGMEKIHTSMILSVQVIHPPRFMSSINLIEIVYLKGEWKLRKRCRNKEPRPFTSQVDTVGLLLKFHPELAGKTIMPYKAKTKAEIADHSLRKPDPIHKPEQLHVYRTTHPRDPYFDRARPHRRKTS
ncbi:MAG: hypothetical protein IPP33_13675 [Flavobacteriales bacterium]|nr:hypothetical protein [Flavobacteriales bacterium]